MEINLNYEQLNAEYSMLMSVLGASVSKHLIDGHYTCIWANDYYYDLIRYPKPQYEALFHSHCDEYFYNNPEGWSKLVETVNSALEQGKKRLLPLSAHGLPGRWDFLGLDTGCFYR